MLNMCIYRLNERLQEVLDENRELREIRTDMERVKAAFYP